MLKLPICLQEDTVLPSTYYNWNPTLDVIPGSMHTFADDGPVMFPIWKSVTTVFHQTLPDSREVNIFVAGPSIDAWMNPCSPGVVCPSFRHTVVLQWRLRCIASFRFVSPPLTGTKLRPNASVNQLLFVFGPNLPSPHYSELTQPYRACLLLADTTILRTIKV